MITSVFYFHRDYFLTAVQSSLLQKQCSRCSWVPSELNDTFGCGQPSVQISACKHPKALMLNLIIPLRKCLCPKVSTLKFRAGTLKFRESNIVLLYWYSSMLPLSGEAVVKSYHCLPLTVTCFALSVAHHLHITPRLFPQPWLPSLSSSGMLFLHVYIASCLFTSTPQFLPSTLSYLWFLTSFTHGGSLSHNVSLQIPTLLISHQASIPKAFLCSSVLVFISHVQWFSLFQ